MSSSFGYHYEPPRNLTELLKEKHELTQLYKFAIKEEQPFEEVKKIYLHIKEVDLQIEQADGQKRGLQHR